MSTEIVIAGGRHGALPQAGSTGVPCRSELARERSAYKLREQARSYANLLCQVRIQRSSPRPWRYWRGDWFVQRLKARVKLPTSE
ncbi:hypothetical protein D9M68_957940 [compost metagenome]